MKFFKKILLGIALNSLAILACQVIFNRYFNDFYFQGTWTQLITLASIFTFLNFFIKPILRLIFLPVIWITLGFFSLIINIIVLKIATSLTTSLVIHLPLTWFVASIVFSFLNSLIHKSYKL